MINAFDGSSGIGRGVISPRVAGPAETPASDPARKVSRVAAAAPVAGNSIARAGLVKELASAPPVNAARVAELRAQIAQGSYQIDADAIARAMLSLDRGTS
ncbi:flagellar biosynthesis anti-sigma factor FlgM [Sandarakinorhabdus sp.]|uniref:flagellar biosynthesis anti-sigma factor FlgM n=1 Tax=Sandarakinorhabdus sp. TaxID=1916663 RepID=UPI0033405BFD